MPDRESPTAHGTRPEHSTNLEAFVFGKPDRRLYGCWHRPDPGARMGTAQVICPPMGHEYIRFHRALRQLGRNLRGRGIDVLRFDYFGSGDSQGSCEEARVSRWPEDVTAALSELESRAGLRPAGLIGLRLGGTLAAVAAAETGGVPSLVLWDPVVSGRVYLEELRRFHAQMMAECHVVPGRDKLGPGTVELLGFAIAEACMEFLGGIDLLNLENRPAGRLLVLQSREDGDQRVLAEHLESLGCEVTYRRQPLPRLWEWEENLTKVQVPQQLLHEVASWLDGGSP